MEKNTEVVRTRISKGLKKTLNKIADKEFSTESSVIRNSLRNTALQFSYQKAITNPINRKPIKTYHSKGDWFEDNKFEIVNRSGVLIKTISTSAIDENIAHVFISGKHDKTGRANLKLMLAAPSMVELLLSLKDYIDNNQPNGLFATMINQVLKKAI